VASPYREHAFSCKGSGPINSPAATVAIPGDAVRAPRKETADEVAVLKICRSILGLQSGGRSLQ